MQHVEGGCLRNMSSSSGLVGVEVKEFMLFFSASLPLIISWSLDFFSFFFRKATSADSQEEQLLRHRVFMWVHAISLPLTPVVAV